MEAFLLWYMGTCMVNGNFGDSWSVILIFEEDVIMGKA